MSFRGADSDRQIGIGDRNVGARFNISGPERVSRSLMEECIKAAEWWLYND
jgi:hypothetical protein